MALLSQAKTNFVFFIPYESYLKWPREQTKTRIKVFCHQQTNEQKAMYGGSTLPKNCIDITLLEKILPEKNCIVIVVMLLTHIAMH